MLFVSLVTFWGSLGGSFGVSFRVFFWFVHMGCQKAFWGGNSDHFGYHLEASGVNLGVFLRALKSFGIPLNNSENL